MIQEYLKRIDKTIAAGPYEATWESLVHHPMPEWYANARFGIFIHWGVYTVPAYYSEWYPYLMYFRQNPVYWHHRKKYGPNVNYHDFIPQFKGEHFDAQLWLDQIKDSGARFILPVGEHHDGFKMYHSDLNRWNSVNMGPHRDVIGELAQAAADHSMALGISNHRAEHYWYFSGGRTVGYKNATEDGSLRDFYGPCEYHEKRNGLRTLMKFGQGITPSKEWLEDWLATACEVVDRYRPAAMYFDSWASNKNFRPYMKKFLAYYYNRSVEWHKEVCVFYKRDAAMPGSAVYVRERGQLPDISPTLWQCETSTARNAWSWCTTNHYKPVEEIACNMLDILSKNGCFVLNIGPKSDGTLGPEDQHILKALGQWTRKNAEALWGTTMFRLFGEGKAQKAGSFSEKYHYTKKDFRFMFKDSKLYAFALVPEGQRVFCIHSLPGNEDLFNYVIKDIRVLGYEAKIAYTFTKKYLKIMLEEPLPTRMPVCFRISLD